MKRPNWVELIAIAALLISSMNFYLETIKHNTDYDHLLGAVTSMHHDLNNYMDLRR